jgi:hypothetical protein
MHVLLNDNGEDDLLCVQEPWFNPVCTVRCDNMIQGKDVLGGAANPKWHLAYPSFTNSQSAKVMTYIRLHDRYSKFHSNHCQMIIRNDMASHPCLLITDIRIGTYYWQVINIYNDVDDPSALSTLLNLDLDATIPTLVLGDFNLHSPSWSPGGWQVLSNSAWLEEWMAMQTFDLLTKPQIPTCMGEGGGRNSTINLAWWNMVVQVQGIFVGTKVDFGGSQGSDHALICTIASTPVPVHRAKEDRMNQFDMDIDAEAREEWDCILCFHLPPLLPLHDGPQINNMVNAIYSAFNEACKATMKLVGPAPGFNSWWWNDDCHQAAQAMRGGFWTDEEQHVANHHLKEVVRVAKQDWANEFIMTANVWEVSRMRSFIRFSELESLSLKDDKMVSHMMPYVH